MAVNTALTYMPYQKFVIWASFVGFTRGGKEQG